MKSKYPDGILVYVCDYADGEPIFAVAVSPDEIPEDISGQRVATYLLARTQKFQVERRLE